MSGEKSKLRTVIIWFIIPWILFAVAIVVLYMKTRTNSVTELGSYINLMEVQTEELVILDAKRAISEKVLDDRNMPQYIEGTSDVGILLIHGFTASPYEMNELGTHLNAQYSYSIYNTRVAGHGSNPENLELLSYKDWYESIKLGYSVLKKNNKKLFIVGQSMGALLSISVALENTCDGVVLLSPAIAILDPKFKVVPVAKHFVKKVKKSNFEEKLSRFYYDVRPLHGLDQLSKLIQHVKDKGDQLDKPTIVLQSIYDDIVDAEAVIGYFDKQQNIKDKSLVVFKDDDRIKHVLTNELNPEREKVFRIVGEWLEERIDV